MIKAFFLYCRKMRRSTIIFILILPIFGCATLPDHLAVPSNNQSSIIGMRVKHRAPLRFFQQYAQRVYFIKIDDEDSILCADQVYPANYISFSHAYLVNARPGTYAVVATAYKKTNPEDLKVEYPKSACGPPEKLREKKVEWIYTIFNEDLIKATIVTVKPGSVVFVGDLCVDQDIFLFNIMNTDKFQLHFMQLVRPSIDSLCFYSGKKHTLDRDHETELKFMRKAHSKLKNTAWEPLFSSRLDELLKNFDD